MFLTSAEGGSDEAEEESDEAENKGDGEQQEDADDVEGEQSEDEEDSLSAEEDEVVAVGPSEDRVDVTQQLSKLSLESKSRKLDVKRIVSEDVTRAQARNQRKYHSKRAATRAGRGHGSKAKQDNRVKQDAFWD